MCFSQGNNIFAYGSGKHQITITSRRSSDEIIKENKRKRIHEDCCKVVGGNESGLTFLNNNRPREEEETRSVALTKMKALWSWEGY